MSQDPLHSLDQAATEVGRVHAAAAQAARQISAVLGDSCDASRSGPLLAGLSATVIQRIEAIRGDCEQLSGLLERATSLGGERPQASPASNGATPTTSEEPIEDDAPQEAAESEELQATPAFEHALAPAARVIRSAGGAQVVAIDGSPVEPQAEVAPKARRLWRREGTQPAAAAAAPQSVNSEGVRLVVKQMAIAGAGRTEIERRLRIQFGVNDADGALNEIFGERRQSAQETA